MRKNPHARPVPDDLARQYLALAGAYSRELHDATANLARKIGANPLTVIMTLASHTAGDEDDLDDDQREVLTTMHAVPGFAVLVACLRGLRIQEAAAADQIGRRLGWEPADSREILTDYSNSTTGDGHPEGFIAWLRYVAAPPSN